MKKIMAILITAALLLIPTACLGQQYRGYSRHDKFTDTERYYNERGQYEGYSRFDKFTGHTRYFNRDGKQIGESHHCPFTDEERYTDKKPMP